MVLVSEPVRGRSRATELPCCFFCFNNGFLWHLFRPIFLQENVGGNTDNQYAMLLNRARVGMLTDADKRLLIERLQYDHHDFEGALRIFPTRKQVSQYNAECQNNMQYHTCIIQADHYSSSYDVTPGKNVHDSHIPQHDSDAGGLPNILNLSIGTRVMLIRNILTDVGLVNGAMGSIVSFDLDSCDLPVHVNVRFDDPLIGRTFQKSTVHDTIQICPILHTFVYKGRSIVRKAFPLSPCWACTIHKVQGLSLDKAVIDIGSGIFENGMAYVALSRVKTLLGLALLALNPSCIQPFDQVLVEYDRLRHLPP